MISLQHPSDDAIVKAVFVVETNFSKIVSYLLQISRGLLLTNDELCNVAPELLSFDKDVLNILSAHVNNQSIDNHPLVEELLPFICDRLNFSLLSVTTKEKNILAKVICFLKPTEILLSIGGDDRLTLNIEKLKQTKYLSSTIPSEGLIRRGSCTCSTIIKNDLQLAEKKREEFLVNLLHMLIREDDESLLLHSFPQDITQRLTTALQLSPADKASEELSPQIVLFPSGSDAEFLPLLSGLIRSYRLLCEQDVAPITRQTMLDNLKVFNFVTAAGEVGSGTPNAANGQHFAPFAPSNAKSQAGQFLTALETFRDNIHLKQYKPRNKEGKVVFQEAKILSEVESTLQSASCCVVVLHVVCGSKTGLIYPSLAAIQGLQARYPRRILPVIDACQLRCKLSLLQEYAVNAKCTVLVTGSKFFTGVPFAGGVVLPSDLAAEMEEYASVCLKGKLDVPSVIPVGLLDYITPYDVPRSMPRLQEYLTQLTATSSAAYWYNLGLYLRWSIGLQKIESFACLPTVFVAEFTRLWVCRVKNMVRSFAPWLQLMEDDPKEIEELPTKEGLYVENVAGVSSIVSFIVRVKVTEECNKVLKLRLMPLEENKEFHRLLTVPVINSGMDDVTLSKKVMLGQPVKISEDGKTVLRIALGADMVIDALQSVLSSYPPCSPCQERYLLTQLHQSFTNPGLSSAFASINPFYSSIQTILADDLMAVQKVVFLANTWTQPKLAAMSGLSSLQSLFPSHETRLRWLEKVLFATDRTATFASLGLGIADLRQVQAALRQLDVVNEDVCQPQTKVLYDLDAIDSALHLLISSFDNITQGTNHSFTHCFAVKACPVSFILRIMINAGLGLECASINEVQQALKCGCAGEKIIFDSPCKTLEELSFSLRHSVRMNANSFTDLEKIAGILEEFREQGIESQSAIGLRINPLVGVGSISELSTATSTSKFGVPLFSASLPELTAEALRDEALQHIVQTYAKYPFLSGVMCHVGSQGMSIELMVQGVERIAWLAKVLESQHGRKISWMDIGGGLSANYNTDSEASAFAQYASLIRTRLSNFFTESQTGCRFFTEFGKSIITKTGVIVSAVEDVLHHSTDTSSVTVTGICHMGADLMLRTAYCPDKFPHRVVMLDAQHALLRTGREEPATPGNTVIRPAGTVTLVGPLCFSGDVIVRNQLNFPIPERGDELVVLDAGANTLSLFSRHCSRNSPVVYAFRQLPCLLTEDSQQVQDHIIVHAVRERETDDAVLDFWAS